MTNMPSRKRAFVSRLAVFAAGLLLSTVALAAGGGNLQQAGTDLSDKASLQRFVYTGVVAAVGHKIF